MVFDLWKKFEHWIWHLACACACFAFWIPAANSSASVKYVEAHGYVPFVIPRTDSLGSLIESQVTDDGYQELVRARYANCRFPIEGVSRDLEPLVIEFSSHQPSGTQERLLKALLGMYVGQLSSPTGDLQVKITFDDIIEQRIQEERIDAYSNSSALTDECVDAYLGENHYLVSGVLSAQKITVRFYDDAEKLLDPDDLKIGERRLFGGPNLNVRFGDHVIEIEGMLDLGYLATRISVSEELAFGGLESTTLDANFLRPPGIQEQGYFRTFVWFGTDRAEPEDEFENFSGERGKELSWGRVEVSIPDTHSVGVIESPAWYRVFNREDRTDFVVVLDVQKFDGVTQFVTDVKRKTEAVEALVFIHGFNVPFNDAAKRVAQLAYDLKFEGVPLLYSWPSAGQETAYLKDADTIIWTRAHLYQFLQTVVSDLGLQKVHLVAHSMGNRALLDVLASAEFETGDRSAGIHQLVMAAPDVGAGIFKQLAERFSANVERATLYTSSKDLAIIASKKFNQTPRAGGTLTVVDGVDTIDATAAKTSFLGHSYYGTSILDDLFDLIKHDLAPDNRFGLKKNADPIYWKIQPRP